MSKEKIKNINQEAVILPSPPPHFHQQKCRVWPPEGYLVVMVLPNVSSGLTWRPTCVSYLLSE